MLCFWLTDVLCNRNCVLHLCILHFNEQVNIIILIEFWTFSQATCDQEVKKALLQTDDVSLATSSTPPVSPTSLLESPTSPTDAAQAASTEISSVKPRRRSGRPRPRPTSDYGQLFSRKHCIPEEQRAKQRTENDFLLKDCNGDGTSENGESLEGCSVNRDVQSFRERPLSVIGGVDLFSPNAEEKDDRLPSVSLYSHTLTLLEAWRGFVCVCVYEKASYPL